MIDTSCAQTTQASQGINPELHVEQRVAREGENRGRRNRKALLQLSDPVLQEKVVGAFVVKALARTWAARSAARTRFSPQRWYWPLTLPACM